MFNKNLLSAAIAMVAAFGAVHVFAQEAVKEEAVDEIVVSGIRASLTKALDIKKEKMAIVDSIVTEDIGKFPDNNVVESLQRVPGIQVTGRTGGETGSISIRGLDDVYTTVNGRKVFTGVGQGFALRDIPASLLKQVDVYKTRDSSQIETGIAGVVDVKTSRPFDFDGSKVVLAGRSVYAEQSDSNDPVVSMMASDRWDTSFGEFGALLNLSKTSITSRDQHINPGAVTPFFSASPSSTDADGNAYRPYAAMSSDYWSSFNTGGGLDTAENATIPVNGVNETYIQGHDAFLIDDRLTKRERTGVNLSLQYAPNDTSEYTFETFYNGYDNSEDKNWMLYFFGNAQPSVDGTVATMYPGSNILKSRTYAINESTSQMFTSADYNYGHTDSILYALAGKWDIGDKLKVKSELVYQTSTFSNAKNALRLDRTYIQPVAIDYDYSNGLPFFKFLDNPSTAFNEEDVTSAGGWKASTAYIGEGKDRGYSTAFTTDANYEADWGIVTSIDFGLRAERRNADQYTTWGGRGSDTATSPDGLLQSMPGLTHVNTDYFGGEAYLPSGWLNADAFYIKNHLTEFRTALNFSLSPMDLQFSAQEDAAAAYINTKFETELGGKVIDGAVGLRYVNYSTDVQFLDHWDADEVIATYASNTVKEDKLLPSIMVRYHITDELMARASYTQTTRRPEFGGLNPIIVFNAKDVPEGQLGTASGGNPDLKSTESENYDLSLEWYFDEGSSLFGTIFQRDITGLIVNTMRQEVHPKAKDDPTPWTYRVTQPTNSSDGKLTGAELGLVWFPKNLPDVLDGFGVQASYTALSSSQTVPVTDVDGLLVRTDTNDMFAVSDSSYSVVLAYDKHDVGVRLSYAWRSKFLRGTLTGFANPDYIWSKPEDSLDLQISYKITDDFEVTLDGTNLTGSIYQEYYTDPRFKSGYDLISRTFAIGARYSF
jgi:iron complex outermembrane receptor protein